MASRSRARLVPPRSVRDIEELLDSIDDQISMWDADMRLLYANRAVLSWLDCDRDRVRGLRFADIAGSDVAEHLAPFFDIARLGRPVDYERVLDGPGGELRTLAIRVSPRCTDGEVTGFALFGTDRTAQLDARSNQQREAVRAGLLIERERVGGELDDLVLDPLRAILGRLRPTEASSDVTLIAERAVTDLDDAIAEIRRAIARLEQPVGPSADDALPTVPRRAAGETWDPRLPDAVDTPVAVLGWSLADALDFVDELPGLSAWDTDQVNCFGNRLAVRGIGADSRTAMIGRSRVELFGTEVAARSLPYAQAAASGTAQRFDSRFVDGGGTTRTVHFVYHPVVRDGQPIGMVAILNDVERADASDSAVSVAVLERDRRRIAEDLHDHVIQQLYAAGLALDSPPSDSDTAASHAHAAICIAAAIDALGISVHALHADAPGDLAASITSSIRRAEPALGLVPRVDLIGDLREVAPGLAAELLAVLTEALSNVARHAGADNVHVILSAGAGSAWLRVADDGRGIERLTRSSGLSNMRNRAARLNGTFVHHANTPRGTIIDWRVPL